MLSIVPIATFQRILWSFEFRNNSKNGTLIWLDFIRFYVKFCKFYFKLLYEAFSR